MMEGSLREHLSNGQNCGQKENGKHVQHICCWTALDLQDSTTKVCVRNVEFWKTAPLPDPEAWLFRNIASQQSWFHWNSAGFLAGAPSATLGGPEKAGLVADHTLSPHSRTFEPNTIFFMFNVCVTLKQQWHEGEIHEQDHTVCKQSWGTEATMNNRNTLTLVNCEFTHFVKVFFWISSLASAGDKRKCSYTQNCERERQR